MNSHAIAIAGATHFGSTSLLKSDQFRAVEDNIEKLNNLHGSWSSTGPTKLVSVKVSLEETLFDALAAAKILTSKVSMHLDQALRDKLFNQIDRIHEIEDWDKADHPIKSESYRSFLKWLVVTSPLRGPGLGLTSSGNLIAAWMAGADRLILEFLKNDKVKWLVKRQHLDEVEIGSGQTTIERMREVLAPYNPESFFKKKE